MNRPAHPGRAVAIGGGTGLPRVLRALLRVGFEPAAVVTMADDGGSSGQLRREFGILPPGDARNCLVALAPDDSTLGHVFQYRFEKGDCLEGHSLGNLVIAALADMTSDFVAALHVAGQMLDVRGRVLPSTLSDVTLLGEALDGSVIEGQSKVAHHVTAMRSVALRPHCPPGYGAALNAVRAADVVVIGPGSLYTSVLPNFLVDGMLHALEDADARVVYVCNVANQRGETAGMDSAAHVDALLRHGLEGMLDLVLVQDDSAFQPPPTGPSPVSASPQVLGRIIEMGVEVVTADLVDRSDPLHHDVDKLTEVLERIV